MSWRANAPDRCSSLSAGWRSDAAPGSNGGEPRARRLYHAAADDAAIWRNHPDAEASLIVATDKKSGLLVYDLAGVTRYTDTSGMLNNVDLATMPDGRVIVVASDRNDLANARLRLWRLDTATARLEPLGTVPGGAGEGYGVCLRRDGAALLAYSVLKDGTIHEYRLDLTGILRRSRCGR